MKLNIAYPSFGTCKQFEVTDEELRHVNMGDYNLGSYIEGKEFGDAFEGYTFRIQGGADKDGFPMMHGVASNARVELLLPRGAVGFQTFRGRSGERRRKSIRGMTLGHDIAVLNVIIVKPGEKPIPGVTDEPAARRLGPKRANNIRKTFNLKREEEVKNYVQRRVKKDDKKDRIKTPKVQRLITPAVRAMRARKARKHIEQLRKNAEERREYLSLVSRRRMVARQRKSARKQLVASKTFTANFKTYDKRGAAKVKNNKK